jgi:hypothetical protein
LVLASFCSWSEARPHGGTALPVTGVSVVINNFNGAGTSETDEISHLDVANNQINAVDGQLLQVGNVVYQFGTSYGCGRKLNTPSTPFCGFPVYTSTDLLHWTKLGFLFDATTPTWQTNCATDNGCWGPHMIYNAANNNYVLWFVGTGAPGATDNYYMFTCTLASAGANFACTQGTAPSHLAHLGDDYHLFVDPNTQIGYIVYSAQGSFYVYIDQLNSSYTDSTGTSILVQNDGPHEGEGMIYNAGSSRPYVVMYSGQCPNYCQSGLPSWSMTATSPMGTYANATEVNATSCGGQMRSADTLTAAGNTIQMYQSEQWYNQDNPGMANIYYQPLSFDGGGNVVPFSCNTTVSVAGFLTNPPTPPAAPSGADQQNFGDQYLGFADFFTPSIWRMQTFVPTSTTLSKILMPLGQAYTSGGALNADPVVELVSLDGSNNPVSVLASVTVPRASLQWSLQMTEMDFNYSGLTPGAPYGIILKNAASQGLVAEALYTGSTNPYSAGVMRYTTNSGSTWTTVANQSLEFATFP